MGEITGYDRVKFLAYEHPEWIEVLEAVLVVRSRAGSDKFAGAWVHRELRNAKAPFLPNNLRPLVRAGIIQKIGDSTRGGHRSYYALVDAAETEQALRELKRKL